MTTQSLDDAFAAADVARALTAYETSGRPTITRVRYTHDAMIDMIIANPSVLQKQLAQMFGFTEGWVSIVINSDAFKARLAQRKEELSDPTILLTLNERFNSIVVRSLNVLQEKLATADVSKIPDNLVLRSIELGSKALGVGGNAPPAPPPTDHLTALADRLLALQGKTRGVLTYDEGSSTFELVPTVQPDAAGSSAVHMQSDAASADEVEPRFPASHPGDGGQSGREVASSQLAQSP